MLLEGEIPKGYGLGKPAVQGIVGVDAAGDAVIVRYEIARGVVDHGDGGRGAGLAGPVEVPGADQAAQNVVGEPGGAARRAVHLHQPARGIVGVNRVFWLSFSF